VRAVEWPSCNLFNIVAVQGICLSRARKALLPVTRGLALHLCGSEMLSEANWTAAPSFDCGFVVSDRKQDARAGQPLAD
jgi:hypothetical protein